MPSVNQAPRRPEQENAPTSCKFISGDYGVKCQRDGDHAGQHRYETPDGQQGVTWDHLTDEPPTDGGTTR